MKKFIVATSFLLLATLCYGQHLSPAKGIVINGGVYPDNALNSAPVPWNWEPYDAILLRACVILHDPNTGQVIGRPNGVPITLSEWYTVQSGPHLHDGNIATRTDGQNFPQRPNTFINDPYLQLSGVDNIYYPGKTAIDGCATWHVRFNGFAGWYSFQFFAPGVAQSNLSQVGYNIATKVGFEFGSHLSDLVSSPKQLNPLPNDPSMFVPNGFIPVDGQHTRDHELYPGANAPLGGIFLTSAVEIKLPDVLITYRQLLNGSNVVCSATCLTFYGNNLPIARGSVEDGGISDNQLGAAPGGFWVYTYPWWNPSVNETHFYGTELDIMNPRKYRGESSDIATLFFMEAMDRDDCELGRRSLNADHMDLINSDNAVAYWKGQDYIHFVCDTTKPFKPVNPQANTPGLVLIK